MPNFLDTILCIFSNVSVSKIGVYFPLCMFTVPFHFCLKNCSWMNAFTYSPWHLHIRRWRTAASLGDRSHALPCSEPRAPVPTLALASTRAPFLRRHRTTSTWPARAAMCRAVSPRCQETETAESQANPPRGMAHDQNVLSCERWHYTQRCQKSRERHSYFTILQSGKIQFGIFSIFIRLEQMFIYIYFSAP